MNIDRKVVEQALEALREVTGWEWTGPMRVMDEVDDAITALRQALEQEENLYAHAGVKVWEGNFQATQFITRTAIENEAGKGMCLHTAADWCLQQLKEKNT